MKSKLHKLEGCRRLLEIELPQAKLDEKLNELYESASKRASVPGFRVGKVPRDLIKAHYGEQLKEEAVKGLISSSFAEAAKEHSISFVSMPEVTEVKSDDGKGLRFKAQLEIRPNVKPPSYKGLRIKKAKPEVKDEEVDKVITFLRDSAAEFVTISDRPIQKGDYIICDITTSIDNKVVEKKDKLWLHLEEPECEPHFVTGLLGAKQDEVREVKGKEAHFKVTITQIKEKKLPALDDEFAKDMGTYKTLDELKSAIRKDLENRAELKAKADMKNELLDKLVGEAKFDLPQSLLDAQAKRFEERSIENMRNHSVNEAQIETMDAELKKRCRDEAVKTLKAFFILERIAEAEGIKVTENELGLRIEGFAQRYRKTKEAMREHLEEKGLLESIMIEIREEKALEFLLNHARVEE